MAALAAALLMPHLARAQDHGHHHHGAAQEGHRGAFHVGMAAEAAAFDLDDQSGNYEGLTASLSWTYWRLAVRGALGMYRVAHGEMVSHGPGDFSLGLDASVLDVGERDGGRVRAGLGSHVTLPSGNSDQALGMGHVMLMPGAWVGVDAGPWSLMLAGHYGRALGSAEHHHHHGSGPWPIIQPMNASELGGAARVGYAASADRVHVHASLGGAVPVADDHGQSRAVAGAGTRLMAGAWGLGIELQVPVAGQPFSTRGVIDMSYRF